jgi:hypothetical protein
MLCSRADGHISSCRPVSFASKRTRHKPANWSPGSSRARHPSHHSSPLKLNATGSGFGLAFIPPVGAHRRPRGPPATCPSSSLAASATSPVGSPAGTPPPSARESPSGSARPHDQAEPSGFLYGSSSLFSAWSCPCLHAVQEAHIHLAQHCAVALSGKPPLPVAQRLETFAQWWHPAATLPRRNRRQKRLSACQRRQVPQRSPSILDSRSSARSDKSPSGIVAY